MRYSQNSSSMRNLRLVIALNRKMSSRPWNSKTTMEKSMIKRMMKNQKPKKTLNLKRKASRKRKAKPGKSRDSGGVLVKQRENLLQLLQPFKSSGHLNPPPMMRKLRLPRRTKRRRGQRLWDQLHNNRKTLRHQCSTAS